MKIVRRFDDQPRSIGAARRLLRDSLVGRVDQEQLEAGMLMVSELATNSIRHARTGFDLTISVDGALVEVSITDSGSGVPTPRRPAPFDPSGRGLHVVEALSHEWGYSMHTGGGKTVWFRIPAASPSSATGERLASG